MRGKTPIRLILAAVLLAALLWLANAIAPFSMLLAAILSKDHFTHCTADPRIFCEPGSEALAAQVAPHIDHAVATVTKAQFGGFARPIVIYTYVSEGSFIQYTGMRQPRAAVLGGEMHVSPRVLRAPDGPGPVLIHEMSHLQLSLALGTWTVAAMPHWFGEGLATYVSGGAGAEMATEAGAVFAMAEGRCIVPEPQVARLSLARRIPASMRIDMFYRQGAMFVGFLHAKDPAAFGRMMVAMGRKATVGDAASGAYGQPLDALWKLFLVQARDEFNRKSGQQVAALCQ